MLKRILTIALAAPLLVLAGATPALADMASDVKFLNDGWAHVTYEVKGSSTQTKALDKLAKQAATVVARYPGKAEPLLWQGILTSEQANRANMFHKLTLATKARDIIAKAYAIDPRAAQGGPAMSLGVLYYKGEGITKDYKKAVACLDKAMTGGHAHAFKVIYLIREQVDYQWNIGPVAVRPEYPAWVRDFLRRRGG